MFAYNIFSAWSNSGNEYLITEMYENGILIEKVNNSPICEDNYKNGYTFEGYFYEKYTIYDYYKFYNFVNRSEGDDRIFIVISQNSNDLRSELVLEIKNRNK